MKIHFLILTAFSMTGGIEKFNRAFMKALNEIVEENKLKLSVLSVYDLRPDKKYIDDNFFKGFGGNKINFLFYCLINARKMHNVIIGHINLAPAAFLIKILNPKVKFVLIGHGIEIWEKQRSFKNYLLKVASKILAVSNYTREKIIFNNRISPEKVIVLHNTVDPYFKVPTIKAKPEYLIKRYQLSLDTKIILTLTRISKNERYKGYDKVIQALPGVLKKISKFKYILCGKHDDVEKSRILKLVNDLGLKNHFILTGFIDDNEVIDHYLLADVFILPSKKEGFGIVFIEAAACGIPVIAGNKDGSVDATLNGEIGINIDPDDISLITSSLINLLNKPNIPDNKLIFENFGFNNFKKKLYNILNIIQ